MNLIQKLSARFRRTKYNNVKLAFPENVRLPYLKEQIEQFEKGNLSNTGISMPAIPGVMTKPKPRGRVIKQTRHSEFNPNSSRHGGRIVKVMPRQLQKIKAAQEKVEDDSQPSVTDLEG